MGNDGKENDEIAIKDLYNLMKDSSKQNVILHNELKQEINNIREEIFHKIQILEQENLQLKDENKNLNSRLSFLEKQQKKYNIVLYGLQENNEDLLNAVLKIFNNHLNINCQENAIRDLHRIGREKSEKTPRPIVIEFLSYRLKNEILNNAKKLKSTGIYLAKDYIQEEYQARKFLAEQLKIARKEHPESNIKNNTLVVNAQKYTIELLKENSIDKILHIGQSELNSPTHSRSDAELRKEALKTSAPQIIEKKKQAKIIPEAPAILNETPLKRQQRTRKNF